jgi:Putative adhesin
MGNYPPPPYTPPGPPYGGDWKYQRQVLKQQARVQRDMLKAQRDAYRYQIRGLRRSSILGPILLISFGVLFLLVQIGHMHAERLWDWYGRFWPFLLVAAGIVLLVEWAVDQHIQADPTQPRYRRRLGGGVFTLLFFLVITGLIFSGVRHGHSRLFDGMNINQDNWDEFMGDKHESDQALTQALPAGAAFSVDNPRGDVTLSGTSDDNQIHIAVHKEVYTRSDSEADSKAERLSPKLNNSGNTVMLAVPALDGARADLTITLPPATNVTITANHGDVRVSALKAPVIVTANHGDISLSAITGAITTHINNGDSSFSAHSVTGAITLQGHGRDTTLSDLSGPVTIDGDFFGTSHFEHIRGPIKFHTSRTDFQLARLDGEVEIGPDLSASEAVGPLTLTTGNRNVTLDRVSGDISVTNRNGSVDVTGAPPLGNVTIQNRNGSVDMTVPEQAGFNVQVDTTNGDIESEFPEIKIPDGGLQKKTVSGTVGKGGPTLNITTSQGDISLKKASIMPLPPMPPAPPRLTTLPPDVHKSIADAKAEAREAEHEAREAAAEAKREAREAAAEAKQAAKDKQQDKDQN